MTSTLKSYIESTDQQWKIAGKALTEILATHGEPPLYTNRLNRLRAGYQPTQPERSALIEWCGLDDFRDDPSQPFKSRRYSSE